MENRVKKTRALSNTTVLIEVTQTCNGTAATKTQGRITRAIEQHKAETGREPDCVIVSINPDMPRQPRCYVVEGVEAARAVYPIKIEFCDRAVPSKTPQYSATPPGTYDDLIVP